MICNNKLIYFYFLVAAFLFSCSGNKPEQQKEADLTAQSKNLMSESNEGTSSDAIGIGKFTDVALTHPLDAGMIKKGSAIFDTKCVACHKLTDEKLVGPGWKGVTNRRTPEWIMNFATNPDEMLNKDATSQAMLTAYMVRMPNQNITDNEARQLLEFMRKNDNKK